ncbi:hypothetical protein [Roseofilum capinflatum]|uniref:Uncharacterized protein n=1 Tax=Roseofilum capinflatum BLCC-M114 TaxID=3022440 RepID=A0ABT7B8G7_9CYAN|nr:hypothetical protein [Roseofilum capinflatum]MDJ1175471.1 hypothetical protein [Roseofilum capinflatum BLCC-M114]
MFQFFSSQIQRLTTTLAHSSSLLTPLAIALVVSLGNSTPSLAQTASRSAQTVTESERVAHFPDGIYFYGESPQRDQLGQGYMVFEAREQNLLGAFYLPHSSFDCFYGQVTSNQLAMTVINSYDRTAHAYQMGLEPVAIASNETLETQDLQFKPQGFHRIPELSDLEHEILETCRQDLQDH